MKTDHPVLFSTSLLSMGEGVSYLAWVEMFLQRLMACFRNIAQYLRVGMEIMPDKARLLLYGYLKKYVGVGRLKKRQKKFLLGKTSSFVLKTFPPKGDCHAP